MEPNDTLLICLLHAAYSIFGVALYIEPIAGACAVFGAGVLGVGVTVTALTVFGLCFSLIVAAALVMVVEAGAL